MPIVVADRQFVIELTVVLDDSPVNVSGTQFVNTAKWDFGRLIDDVFYEPLPGEWGITEPLTIAAPELVATKTGPATMNLGEWGDFVVDIQNVGLSEAWDVSLRDLGMEAALQASRLERVVDTSEADFGFPRAWNQEFQAILQRVGLAR